MSEGGPQSQLNQESTARITSPPSAQVRARGAAPWPAFLRRAWSLFLCAFLALAGFGTRTLQAEDRPPTVLSRNPADVRQLPPGYHELSGAHMVFQVPEVLLGRARGLLPQAERMREELLDALLPLPTPGTTLPVLPDRRWVIRLAEDETAFLALQPGKPPPWAAGVAWPSYGLIVLRTDRADPLQQQPLEQVLRHELVHLLLSDLFGLRPVPRWFDEGVARLLAREASVDQWVRLSQAVVMDALIPFRSLETQFPLSAGEAEIAYAQSREFLRWLIERFGPELLPGLVQELRDGQTLNEALWRQTRYGLKALERQWQDQLESSFAWVSALGGGMTLLWGLGAVLLVLGWRRRKEQSLLRHARWDEEEAQELALRATWERMERAARFQRVQSQQVDGTPLALYNGQMVQPKDAEQALLDRLRQGRPGGRPTQQEPSTRMPASESQDPAAKADSARSTPHQERPLPDDDDWDEDADGPPDDQDDAHDDQDDAHDDQDDAHDDLDETPADQGEAQPDPADPEDDSGPSGILPGTVQEEEHEDPADRPPPGGWLH